VLLLTGLALIATLALATTAAVAVGTKTVTIDPAAGSGATGLVDVTNLTYDDAKAQLAAHDAITLPLAIEGLELIGVTDVTLDSDDAKRSLALQGKAHLPAIAGGATEIDFLVTAVWPDETSTSPDLALAGKAADVELSSLNSLWGSTLGSASLTTARLVVANRDHTLEPAELPASAAGFFDGAVDLVGGVNFQGDLHLDGRLADAFGYAGWSGDIGLEGSLGASPALLFSHATEAQLGALALKATLTKSPTAPEWIQRRTSTFELELSNATGSWKPAVTVSDDVTTLLDGETNRFTGTVSVAPAGAIEAELALDGTLNSPFDLENLTLSQVKLALSLDSGTFRGALNANVTVGSSPVGLSAELETGTAGTTATFSLEGALKVPDLLGFAEDYLDATSVESLPGVGDVTLTRIVFTAGSRTVEGSPERTFSLTADATIRELGASVLLSLRKSGTDPVKPLLGLSLADSGCGGGNCIRLSQLLGNNSVGEAVSRIKVPALNLVVTTLDGLDNPTVAETAFFTGVYGTLVDPITFRPGIDVTARMALDELGDAPREVFGFAPGSVATLRGTLGAGLTLNALGGTSFGLTGLELEATLPPASGGSILPSWLTLDETKVSFAYSAGEVRAGLALAGQVTLDGKVNDFEGALELSSSGKIDGRLAQIGTFDAPFDLGNLTLRDIELSVTIEKVGLTRTFTGALELDVVVPPKPDPLHVKAELSTGPGEVTAILSITGSVSVPELAAFGGDYLNAEAVALTGADEIALSGITFTFSRRTAPVAETVFSLRADATIRSLQASVLLSLRKSGTAPVKPLLGLSLTDPGCSADCIRLRELFGPNPAGDLVGDLEVPALNLVVTQLPKLTNPTAQETAFFSEVFDSLPSEISFKPGIDLSARLPVDELPTEVRDALALEAGREVVLAGTLGASMTLNKLGGSSFTLNELALSAALPTGGSSSLLPDWVSFTGDTALSFSYKQGAISAGFKTAVHIALGEGFDVDLDTSFSKQGLTKTVALRATISDWEHPFGVQWIDRLDTATLKLDLVTGQSLSASLSSSIELGQGRTFTLAIGLSKTTSTSATITAEFDGGATLGEIARAFAADLDGADAAVGANPKLDAVSIDHIVAAATVGGDQGTSISVSADASFKLGSESDIAASLLLSAGSGGSRGSGGGFLLALKANASINLKDIAAAAPDVPVSLPGAALILSSRQQNVPSSQLDDVEFAFMKTIYGCAASSTRVTCKPFTIALPTGLKFVGTVTLPANLGDAADAVGIDAKGPLLVEGTIPFGSVTDFALKISLPPVKLDNADWLDGGSVFFEVSRDGFKLGGSLIVKLPRGEGEADASCPVANRRSTFVYVGGEPVARTLCYDILTFEVAAAIGFQPPSLQFSGQLKTEGGWRPHGAEWLEIRHLALVLGVMADGTISIGFRGSVVLGTKDIAASILLALGPLPGPPGVRLELRGIAAQSQAGVAISDIVWLANKVATASGEPPVNTDALPDIALRNLYFSWAVVAQPELCLKPGLKFNADLYVGIGSVSGVAGPAPSNPCATPVDENPSTKQTCKDRRDDGCLVSAYLSIDDKGIVAKGSINSFDLGPLHFDDSFVHLEATAVRQQFRLSGGIAIGTFASGRADIDFGKTGLFVEGDVKVFNGAFHAYLKADAPFDFKNPAFYARVVLRADFAASFRSLASNAMLVVKPVVTAFGSAVNLVTGQGNLNAFALMRDQLRAAGVAVPPALQTVINGLVDAEKVISDFRTATGGVINASLSLDWLLKGFKLADFGGTLGSVTPRTCVGVYTAGKCWGFWAGPTCWTTWVGNTCYLIPPITGPSFPGVCASVGIDKNSADCTIDGIFRRFVVPSIVNEINRLTGLSLNPNNVGGSIQQMVNSLNPNDLSLAPLSIDCAEFEADLRELKQGKVNVSLATRLNLFGHQLQWGANWNFANHQGNFQTIAWNVMKTLISPQSVTCQGFPPGRETPGVRNFTLAASATPATVDEGSTVTLATSFDQSATSYPAVRVDWGDGAADTIAAGASKTASRTHTFRDDGGSDQAQARYAVAAVVQDSGGHTVSAPVTVRNLAPDLGPLSLSASAVDEHGQVTLNGTFTDPGLDDTHQVAIEWGDGSAPSVVDVSAGGRAFSVPHQYLDDRPAGADTFAITATVRDDDSGADTAATQVEVRNVAPSALSISPTGYVEDGGGVVGGPGVAVKEGLLVQFTVAFADPGSLDSHTFSVDWNDGSPVEALAAPPGARTTTIVHQYAENGAYAPVVTVADEDGGSTTSATSLTVENVAPTVDVAVSAADVKEDETVTLEGTITDPGLADAQTVTIDWGDGSPSSSVQLGAAERTFSVPHRFADDNPTATPVDLSTIAVSVADDDGGSGTAQAGVTVRNVAPSLDAAFRAGGIVVEGSLATLDATIVDSSEDDTHAVTIDWGDGSAPTTLARAAAERAFDASHRYLDDDPVAMPGGRYPVQLETVDDDGGTWNGARAVTVLNAAPSVVLRARSTIDEDGSVTLDGTIVDPGILDTHVVTVDWGDGTAPETIERNASQRDFDPTHDYFDDDPTSTPLDHYAITVRVRDDEGATGSASVRLTLLDIAPTVAFTVTPSGSLDESGTVTLSGEIFDQGSRDGHVIRVDWGAGVPNRVQTLELPAGRRTFSATRAYLDDGRFTIGVTATDDDTLWSSSETQIVVRNLGPTVSLDAAGAITSLDGTETFVARAGRPFVVRGRISDPGSDDLLARWSWRDRTSTARTYRSDGRPLDLGVESRHVWRQPCLHRDVRIDVTDGDGGDASVGTVVVVTGSSDDRSTLADWQEQYRIGRAARRLPSQTLSCYVRIVEHLSTVFGEIRPASTPRAARAILFPSGRGERALLDRQLLTTWLRFADGGLPYRTVAGAVAAAEEARTTGAPEATLKRHRQRLERLNRG
jgi:hypothetical protein